MTFSVDNFITLIILSNIIFEALASLFLVLLPLFISVPAMIYSMLASWDEEHIPQMRAATCQLGSPFILSHIRLHLLKKLREL